MINIEKYTPVFMLDDKEPFEITAIGVTVFKETKKSDSFPKRIINVEQDITYVIEYAVWLDYDIQHLYELEHVWVYVDHDEKVKKVEGSFHGKYLVIQNLDTGKIDFKDETHPVVYMQPGKHAILPDPRLVKIVPDWEKCCNEYAGIDGVLIQEMFEEQISADEELQSKVKKYIKDKYSFVPSLHFHEKEIEPQLIMPWEVLKESIPLRIKKELDKIR